MKRLMKNIESIAEEISKTNVAVYSANAAFFLFLSLFPGLLLLISVTQYTVVSFERVMALLTQLLPDAFLPLLEYASILITVALYTLTHSFLERVLPAGSMLLKTLSTLVHYRWLVSGVLLFALFTVIYMVFPCRRNKLRHVLPGSLAATVGWLVFSALYSHYVQMAGGASSIYGGISIIAFAMLWLYFGMNILFYGAMLCHYLTEHRQQLRGWFGKK